MNYPDEQERADREGRTCADCGTWTEPGVDHGDEECLDVMADKLADAKMRLKDEQAAADAFHKDRRRLERELAAEQTWAARLEGALAIHDCALLGDMRRKYRGVAPAEAAPSTPRCYTRSAAALAEPDE